MNLGIPLKETIGDGFSRGHLNSFPSSRTRQKKSESEQSKEMSIAEYFKCRVFIFKKRMSITESIRKTNVNHRLVQISSCLIRASHNSKL